MKMWVGRESTLVVDGQVYRGKVITGKFVNERDHGRQLYGEEGKGYDYGYAFFTEDGETIRLFQRTYPRVNVVGKNQLTIVDKPYTATSL